MILLKLCRVAGVSIAAALLSASASAAPAVDDNDSAGMTEASGDPGAVATAEDEYRLLDDPRIAAVVDVINTGEIRQAHLALTRSWNPDVRAFARKMIVEHAVMRERQARLLAILGVVPIPNALSARVAADGAAQSAVLRLHRGPTFDILYMHAQIEAHRDVLELLDDQLIPAAREPAFRALLLNARRSVEEHLALSREILVRLGGPR
jgi:putative membrane protein